MVTLCIFFNFNISEKSLRKSIKRPLILEHDRESDFYKGSIEIDKLGTSYYRYVQGASYTHEGRQIFSVLHHENDWLVKFYFLKIFVIFKFFRAWEHNLIFSLTVLESSQKFGLS